jgi:hypothetical protein
MTLLSDISLASGFIMSSLASSGEEELARTHISLT